MSGCANAGQALGRGLKLYTSRNTYTLPFLYQTPTLRRYYSALQDLAKENASKTDRKPKIKRPPREPTSTIAHTTTEPGYEEFVPFETPGAVESAVVQDTIQGESLTGTERHAFAQLEALANAPKRSATKRRELARQNTFISLDDVLNEAITAIEASEKQDLDVEHRIRANAKKSATVLTKKLERGESEFQKLSREDRRTLGTLHNASTDTMLWEILETRLFSQIAQLHLDSPAPAAANITPERRRFLMQTFPLRLVTAASILRRHFPTSNLILAILPRLKQLGPSAYALATTADLYNQLLAFYFRKFSDIDTCNALLQEMEDNIIEPSASTLKVLDYILQYRTDCVKNNKLGPAVKSLFTTEKYRRDFAVMEKWRAKVEQSLAEQESRTQRKLQEREMRSKEELEELELPGLSYRPIREVEKGEQMARIES
ncbi:uncharacterized protein M437DRAFT_57008 [Aureobasidium melanogenum CBS 110374]|uniref:Mtf2-like C-terminal domain-containing protein n=1 Tax=Aureobasidium melanogenum (strain CBS 110374) TaxID=1043003 RepID=A0A074VNV8_AURM1|nr:uncharacterized protein M437DRAFT_57008 [Aureobasidium melanogenum CBS 110374]KEQ59382.1 hypothetical protein M437DRAFT_57008 [Aureobasidium melanogenum CBS 110374]